MKTILAIFFAIAATLCASDYAKDYAELKKKVGKDQLDQYLVDWRTREPENPDAWIHSANWALENASAVNIRGKDGAPMPAGNFNLEMRDGKMVIMGADGKPVGEIGEGGAGPAGVKKAAGILSEALKKWPHRADIHCGLATIYARGALWKEHMESLRGFATAARTNFGKLRWCHDEELTEPEEQLVADKLHGFAWEQFKLETKDGDERFREIAELTIQVCPKSAKGYNDMAVFHGLAKDWKAAQPMLEKAAEADPGDALVWMNLGDNCVRLGNADAARKAFQHVIDLKPDATRAKAARTALEKLDTAKP